jgi:hypothetical protein
VLCPYCASDVRDEAIVCPVCRRDLYLLKSLLERVADLERVLAARGEAESRAAVEPASTASLPQRAARLRESRTLPSPQEWLTRWALPLALLLIAHALIVLVFDLNTVYLRVASLLIPLPFGLLLTATGQRPAIVLAAMAACLALLAVFGMSALVAQVDGTPLLPQDPREWRELFEYAASIGLSYVSGMLMGRILRRAQAPSAARMSASLDGLVSSGVEKTLKLQSTLEKFNELGSAITAAATTLMAVYAGLRAVIGS